VSEDTPLREGPNPEGEPAEYEAPRAEDVSAHDSIDTASMAVTGP